MQAARESRNCLETSSPAHAVVDYYNSEFMTSKKIDDVVYMVSYDLKINMAMSLGFVCNDIDKDAIFYKINFCHVL